MLAILEDELLFILETAFNEDDEINPIEEMLFTLEILITALETLFLILEELLIAGNELLTEFSENDEEIDGLDAFMLDPLEKLVFALELLAEILETFSPGCVPTETEEEPVPPPPAAPPHALKNIVQNRTTATSFIRRKLVE